MRYDLTRIPILKTLLRSRWPQFLMISVALASFILAIAAGLWGTPVGSRNFGIIFVWIAWWAMLMLVAVPLFGRGWCSICPIPAPGEWLQRGALLGPNGGGKGMSRRWPSRLRNIWLQNAAFSLVALFSAVILTQPRVTAVVLLAFLFIATGASLIYERRAFCRYLCPVGGFIGLYAQVSPVEVRIKDSSICAAHTEKTCYTGNALGYGCPWQVFPPGMVKNTYCGTCMECLRTCPHDNIAVNLRQPGLDLEIQRGRKLDEAYKAFIMLGSAVLYSAVLLGPWGDLKMAVYSVGSLAWAQYAVLFLVFVLAILPGFFYLAVWVGNRLAQQAKLTAKTFVSMTYAIIPLGICAWIAFSLSFILANFSYVWIVASDPFGWGWDLFGKTNLAWSPYLNSVTPVLQVIVLASGAAWSAVTARKIASEKLARRPAMLQSTPVAGFCLVVCMILLGLLVG
jgi:polyferredoxin